MANSQYQRILFNDYCDNLIANINFAFPNTKSSCNMLYSELGALGKYCAHCSFDLNEIEAVAAKKLVKALRKYMLTQANLLDLIFSEIEPNLSSGFPLISDNKANLDELTSATFEVLFLSFNSQLEGRKNLHLWLNEFPEDLIRFKYFDEWDVLKNMVMQPSISKLDQFYEHEDLLLY